MRRLEVIGLVLVIIAGLTLGYRQFFSQGPASTKSGPLSPVTSITASSEVDIHAKLDGPGQEKLEKSTQYFCAVEYHRESCIYYMLQCGKPCFWFFNEATRTRILTDYNEMRRGQGLQPLEKLIED